MLFVPLSSVDCHIKNQVSGRVLPTGYQSPGKKYPGFWVNPRTGGRCEPARAEKLPHLPTVFRVTEVAARLFTCVRAKLLRNSKDSLSFAVLLFLIGVGS